MSDDYGLFENWGADDDYDPEGDWWTPERERYEEYCEACVQNDMMPVSFEAWKEGAR